MKIKYISRGKETVVLKQRLDIFRYAYFQKVGIPKNAHCSKKAGFNIGFGSTGIKYRERKNTGNYGVKDGLLLDIYWIAIR